MKNQISNLIFYTFFYFFPFHPAFSDEKVKNTRNKWRNKIHGRETERKEEVILHICIQGAVDPPSEMAVI